MGSAIVRSCLHYLYPHLGRTCGSCLTWTEAATTCARYSYIAILESMAIVRIFQGIGTSSNTKWMQIKGHEFPKPASNQDHQVSFDRQNL